MGLKPGKLSATVAVPESGSRDASNGRTTLGGCLTSSLHHMQAKGGLVYLTVDLPELASCSGAKIEIGPRYCTFAAGSKSCFAQHNCLFSKPLTEGRRSYARSVM